MPGYVIKGAHYTQGQCNLNGTLFSSLVRNATYTYDSATTTYVSTNNSTTSPITYKDILETSKTVTGTRLYFTNDTYITTPTFSPELSVATDTTDRYIIGSDYGGGINLSATYYIPSYQFISADFISGGEDKIKIYRGLAINIKTRANPVEKISPQEQVALDTLREMVTEKEYRKYLKYGFILVRGKSGDIYQIFRNKSHTKVWRGGKLIEEICVRLRDSGIPPTDNVIAFKVSVETSEEEFKSRGNVYKFIKHAA